LGKHVFFQFSDIAFGLSESQDLRVTPQTHEQLKFSCRTIISSTFRKILQDSCYRIIFQRPHFKPRRDAYGRNTIDQQLQQFVDVWNNFRKRTTTYPDDMFAILANLLDFNPSHLCRVPKKDRFSAIVCSLEVLPQSILYNPGNRLQACKNHRNRWVPTDFSSLMLQTTPCMNLIRDGLMLTSQNPLPNQLPDLILVKPALTSATKSVFIRYSYSHQKKPDVFLQVDLLQAPDDEFEDSGYEATCIIIERQTSMEQASGTWKGCCLHVPEKKNREEGYTLEKWPPFVRSSPDILQHYERIIATYDCPALVSISRDEQELYASSKYGEGNLPWRPILDIPESSASSDTLEICDPSLRLGEVSGSQDLFIEADQSNTKYEKMAIFPQYWQLLVECGK